jgi:hypothetical protein
MKLPEFAWLFRAASPLVMILATSVLLAGEDEDTHLIIRPDSGFDSYDFTGRFMGQKIPNGRGGFDFFDAQGMFLGSSRSQVQDRIDFFDMSGNFVKSISSDNIGNISVSGPDGSKFPGLTANYLKVIEFLYSPDRTP